MLELEAELSVLRAQLAEARRQATEAVAETHRQYRRDLVPVSQALVPYERRRRPPSD